MPLESGNGPEELNPSWPLDSDPRALGAAHLRRIKAAVKSLGGGTYATKEDAVTYLTSIGSALKTGLTFTVGAEVYLVIPKSLFNISQDITSSYFQIDANYSAYCIAAQKRLGHVSSQNTTGLANINSLERRRPLLKFVQVISGTSFSDANANTAFPNSAPIANDVCIQFIAGSPSYTFVKFHNGAGWFDVDLTFYSRVAAYGFLGAQLLLAESVDATRVRSRKVEVLGDTKLYVLDPEGFGPDSLMEWYGPKLGVVSTTGEVAYGSLLKANSLYYRLTTGVSGTGGEDPEAPPIPPTDATVLTDLGTIGDAYESSTTTYGDVGTVSNSSVFLTVKTNGTFVFSGQESVSGAPLSGPLLTDTTEGIGDQFEVKFEIDNPANFNGTLDVWQVLTANRLAQVFVTRDTFGSSSVTRSLTVSVRKTVTPGTVESAVISLEATATLIDGIEP